MDTRLLKTARDSDVPVCLHCLQPHSPLDHFCPHCGTTVGQLTPNIPYLSIPFEVDFLGKTWRRVWAPNSSVMMCALCLLIVIACAPILLVGLVFMALRGKLTRKHGLDALVDAERRLAAAAPARLPPAKQDGGRA
jgi:hypothetical protein